jgi:hypothetical protein
MALYIRNNQDHIIYIIDRRHLRKIHLRNLLHIDFLRKLNKSLFRKKDNLFHLPHKFYIQRKVHKQCFLLFLQIHQDNLYHKESLLRNRSSRYHNFNKLNSKVQYKLDIFHHKAYIILE